MKEAKKRAEAMAKPPAALNACKTQEKGTQKKGGKKQAKAMAKQKAQAALKDCKTPQKGPQKKEAKKQAGAMATQKAQAALNACETPQKRPKKQGGSVAKTAKVQGQPLLPVAPLVPKHRPAPAPSRTLGCSKCRRSVTGCLECCPLKHAAWEKRKLEKMEPLKRKVEEEEELLKTQAKKVKTQAKTSCTA